MTRTGVDVLDRWQAADGTWVVIRPMHADDARRELRFIESLSSQTLYERTFSHRGTLVPGELRRLVRYDVREEVALVATIRRGRTEEFAAVIRLKKAPDAAPHEFALVVADAWQRRGIGLRLLEKLLEVSRHAGIARVVGYTFATNEAMKSLARRAGFHLRADPDDASLTLLEIDLTAAAR